MRPIVAADPFAAVTEAGPTSGLSLGRAAAAPVPAYPGLGFAAGYAAGAAQ
jgi:hypothetical protein